MKNNNIVIGIVAGVVIGAVAGILFAPARGSETRSKLSDNGDGFLTNLKNKYNHLIDDITSKLDEVSGESDLPQALIAESSENRDNFGL